MVGQNWHFQYHDDDAQKKEWNDRMDKIKENISRFKPAINILRAWLTSTKKEINVDESGDSTTRFTFVPVGFHGDKYLLDVVDTLAKEVDVFIETGTNVGSTLAFFARKYPHIQCLSCEPDSEAFQRAQRNLEDFANVTLYNQTSQEFLVTLEKQHPDIFQKQALFWLDAHGYGFKWPLEEELAFITTKFSRAWILIDDFKVPGLDVFGFDTYEEQVCSYDYVKGALNPAQTYNTYYPNYTEHTSKHHPKRGWGLITFGEEKDLNFPALLQEKLRLASGQ